MNQKWIAGIGNIYADEILFQSAVHPKEQTNHLSEHKIRNLFQNMKEVLKETIDSQADPERFPRFYLIPQRKKNGRCPHSHGKLKKIKVNGRSAYFCPVCQKLQNL